MPHTRDESRIGGLLADDIVDLLAWSFEPGRVLEALRRGQMTTAGLAEACVVEVAVIEAALSHLIAHGHNIQKFGEHWSLGHRQAPRAEPVVYESRPDGTYLFGIASDTHLGSKYERLDVLNRLYDWFAEKGADRVFNAGNWIEGESEVNRHDLLVHGLEPQVDYLVQNYPRRPGLVTYAICGEDHEGWYTRRESIDIGRFAERKMRDAGRDDWVDLGFQEASVVLRHAVTGATAPPLVVMHPGGGSAYAISYRPQKIVESLQGNSKPSVLIIGHYHKLSLNLIRSVWTIQAGCLQDQTPFLRKLSIEPHLGGALVTLEQDPDGPIRGCVPAFRQYFDKGYENARWNRGGPVVQPQKTEVGPR